MGDLNLAIVSDAPARGRSRNISEVRVSYAGNKVTETTEIGWSADGRGMVDLRLKVGLTSLYRENQRHLEPYFKYGVLGMIYFLYSVQSKFISRTSVPGRPPSPLNMYCLRATASCKFRVENSIKFSTSVHQVIRVQKAKRNHWVTKRKTNKQTNKDQRNKQKT